MSNDGFHDEVRNLLTRATDGPPPPDLDRVLAGGPAPSARVRWRPVAAAVAALALVVSAIVVAQPSDEVGVSADTGWRWEASTPSPLGAPLASTAVAADAGLLVWGGFGPSGAATADGAAYDPVEDEWEMLPGSPLEPRGNAAAASNGHEVFVWGGRDSSTTFADGARFDLANRRWATVPNAPGGARWGATATWFDGRFLVLGGQGDDGEPSAVADAFDPVTGTWEELPALPMDGAADVLRLPSRLLVLPHPEGPCEVVQSTTIGTWEVSSPMGLPASCRAVAAIVGDEVIAGFGAADGSSARWFAASTDDLRWSRLPTPDPSPSDGAVSVGVDRQLVVAGLPCGLNGREDAPDLTWDDDGGWRALPRQDQDVRPRCDAIAFELAGRAAFWGGGVANGFSPTSSVLLLRPTTDG